MIPRCGKLLEDGTQCLNNGEWQPVLLMYAPRMYKNNEPVKAPLGLGICRDHRDASTVDSFLCDEGWAQITAVFMRSHKAVPDRSRTQLAFRRYLSINEEMNEARSKGANISEVIAS